MKNRLWIVVIGILIMTANCAQAQRNITPMDVYSEGYVYGGTAIFSSKIASVVGFGFSNTAKGNGRMAFETSFALAEDVVIPSVDMKFSYRFGKKFYFEPAGIIGVGAICNKIVAENSLFSYKRTVVYLWPELGGGINIGYSGKRFGVSLFAAYKWQIGANRQLSPVVDGMQIIAENKYYSPLMIGGTASLNLSQDLRRCGDHPWILGIAYGYNVLSGEQKVSVDLTHFDRLGIFFGHLYGVEFGQTFGKIQKTSSLLKYGMQFLPRGANSPIIPELSVKAGMGEAINQTALYGEAENGEFSSFSRILQPAVEVGAELKLVFHFGGVSIYLAGEYIHDFPLGTEVSGDGVTSHATHFEYYSSLFIKGGVIFAL
jgi:hypothetical protein